MCSGLLIHHSSSSGTKLWIEKSLSWFGFKFSLFVFQRFLPLCIFRISPPHLKSAAVSSVILKAFRAWGATAIVAFYLRYPAKPQILSYNINHIIYMYHQISSQKVKKLTQLLMVGTFAVQPLFLIQNWFLYSLLHNSKKTLCSIFSPQHWQNQWWYQS